MSHAVQERAVSENYNPAASPYRGSLPALPGQGKQAGKGGIGRKGRDRQGYLRRSG